VAGAAQAVAVVHRPQVRAATVVCALTCAQPTMPLTMQAAKPAPRMRSCRRLKTAWPPLHLSPAQPDPRLTRLRIPLLLPAKQPAMVQVELQARMMRAKEEMRRGSFRAPRASNLMRRQRRIDQARKHN